MLDSVISFLVGVEVFLISKGVRGGHGGVTVQRGKIRISLRLERASGRWARNSRTSERNSRRQWMKIQEEEADCIGRERSKEVRLKSNRLHKWTLGVGVRKFTGATTTTEKLPLKHEEIHGGRQRKRKNTYPGRDELKRWPVVSCGGEAVTLRQEWRDRKSVV